MISADELAKEGEYLRMFASLIILIGTLIGIFGAVSMFGILGAAAKNASSLILFWGMFVFLVGVTVHLYSRQQWYLDRMVMKIPIREIMTRDVITADSNMRASEAAQRMTERKIGSLVVIENGKPVGIVTERDMVQKLISKDVKPSSLTLKDIISQPLITIRPDESLSSAARKMVELNIRRLPVIKNDELVGIVTDVDAIAYACKTTDILAQVGEKDLKGQILQLIRKEKKRE
ncbi:MAG: CBS domain-containing protein [Methanocellales archaeon]|nr:CBS domain-containing protein [Methanocellales archaeon]